MSLPNKFQILVVDDFHDNLFLISLLLESEGYQVESASSGKEALEKIESVSLNLVLMDVRLPDISGLDVIQQIRLKPQFIDLPIILVTGDPDVSFEEAIKLGVNSLMQKPIDLATLLAQVKEIASLVEVK